MSPLALIGLLVFALVAFIALILRAEHLIHRKPQQYISDLEQQGIKFPVNASFGDKLQSMRVAGIFILGPLRVLAIIMTIAVIAIAHALWFA